MLYLLRSGFRRDLIVHLLIVIIVGSALAMTAGYMADNYFGKTVSGLIGDYGEFDLLLTVNREVRNSALSQIQDILRVKLPGSNVQKGITIAGKTNYFVSLDNKFKTKEQFMQIDSYFSNVTGLVGVTVMTEPRLTVRGIPGGFLDQFEQELNGLAGVKFSYPVGTTGVDLMLNSPKDINPVTEQIKHILDKYQVMEVRFPIDSGAVDTMGIGEKLATELQQKYRLAFAKNITTTAVDDQQYLVNTMLEMKKFLMQYATVINIPRPADSKLDIAKDDYLIMPGQGRMGLKPGDMTTPMDLRLQVSDVTDKEIQALIIDGNVTDIQSKEVYRVDSDGKILADLGTANVKSPREDLKYAADQLAKVLPDLDKIFTQLYGMTGQATGALQVYSDTLKEAQNVQQTLQAGQSKVSDIRNKLDQVDLSKIQDFVTNLLGIVKSAEDVSSKMDWAKSELLNVDNNLGQFQGQVETLKKQFGVSDSYGKQLDNAVKMANQIQDKIRNNTGDIMNRINQYNPIFHQMASWRGDLERLQQMIAGGNILSTNTDAVVNMLDRILASSQSTMQYLGQFDNAKMAEQVQIFKTSLEHVQQSDVAAIIKELKYISDTLPNLRDEEVTHNIKLIEKYMAGQVIPGEQVLILIPGNMDVKNLKSFVMQQVGQSTISIFSQDAGVLQPNVRGEFLRIISEVRGTITALVAIVLVLLVLMLDLTSVMAAIKRLRKTKKENILLRVLNSEILFGVVCGSITLEAIFMITQGQLPYIDNHPGAWIGAVLGLIVALFAERINPIDQKEYMAGEALGFNLTEILREVIIPSGKPGILFILNRRNLVFK